MFNPVKIHNKEWTPLPPTQPVQASIPPAATQAAPDFKNLFPNIELSKCMSFKDKPQMSYAEALTQLAESLQCGCSAAEMNAALATALKNAAEQISLGSKPYATDLKVLQAFHNWIHSIHNTNLATPAGQPFPNNIVYDWLSALTRKQGRTDEETLLHFFLDGANARKICQGATPNVDFIASLGLIAVVKAVQQLTGALSPAATQFLEQYGAIEQFTTYQSKLESDIRGLSESRLYASMLDQKVLNFEKTANPNTGANAYAIDQAITKGLNNWASILGDALSFGSTLPHQLVTNLLKRIEDILNSEMLKEVTEQAYKVNDTARQIIMWDMSEWLSRIYVTLRILGNHQPAGELLESFEENPFLRETLERSREGDFPANLRNQAIQGVELVDLFIKAELFS